MISIDPTTQSERDNYKLLIGSVVPRPIAFVTTCSQEGVINAAPFSYFSIVSSSPPLLSVSVQRSKGRVKDTARNAIDRGELVIHIVDESIVADVNQTAASLPPHESELSLTRLTTISSDLISVPGIKEAKIRMECKLDQAIPIGNMDGEPSGDLLIAQVVRFHIAEELYKDGRIDPIKLAPISRMAGTYYAHLGNLFSMERPQ